MREQFKSFLDDIAGVLFSPVAALKKISEEKKVAQSLIVLILSGILPEIAGIRHSLNESILGTFAGRDALPGMDVAHGALTRAVPYIAALMITGAILIIPLVHFIFTAVVELACQFLMPRYPRPAAFVDKSARQEDAGQSHDGGAAVSDAGDAEDKEKNSTLRIQGESCVLSAPASGVGLFAAMAFSTLPMLFMVPVNLLSALAGKNLGLALGIPLRIWVMVLQIISVRQTHGFTAGRAALAYFALPAAAVVAALVFAIFLAALLAPYIPMLP